MNCKWKARGYYAADVKPPKMPGALAIEISSICREGLDIDIEILQDREDIGLVDVFCAES